MSFMGRVSPVKQRVSPGLARSQSYNLEVDNESTAEMLAERDERIRELEETVKMLKFLPLLTLNLKSECFGQFLRCLKLLFGK